MAKAPKKSAAKKAATKKPAAKAAPKAPAKKAAAKPAKAPKPAKAAKAAEAAAPIETLETQLVAALGVEKKKAKEARQAFLERLVDAANALANEAFSALPEPVQGWVNDANSALDAKEAITDPVALAGDETGVSEAAPAKVKAPKKAKAPKEKAEFDVKSILSVGKTILMKDMSLSVDDLMAAMAKAGAKCERPTAQTIRNQFRHSVKLLQALKVDVSKIVVDPPKA